MRRVKPVACSEVVDHIAQRRDEFIDHLIANVNGFLRMEWEPMETGKGVDLQVYVTHPYIGIELTESVRIMVYETYRVEGRWGNLVSLDDATLTFKSPF